MAFSTPRTSAAAAASVPRFSMLDVSCAYSLSVRVSSPIIHTAQRRVDFDHVLGAALRGSSMAATTDLSSDSRSAATSLTFTTARACARDSAGVGSASTGSGFGGSKSAMRSNEKSVSPAAARMAEIVSSSKPSTCRTSSARYP